MTRRSPRDPLEPAAFAEACRRAGVGSQHIEALRRLAAGWPPGRPASERVRAVLEDHAHFQLFERSLAADARAAVAFKRYWEEAARRFMGRGFTREQTEEFAAAFFERVYRKAPGFAFKQPFVPYLRAILVNLARDELRRLRRMRVCAMLPIDDPSLELASSGASPEEAALGSQQRARVWQALEALEPVDRHIVRACLIEGGSGQELAAALGLSRDALYKRLSRARKKLRRLLEERGRSDG